MILFKYFWLLWLFSSRFWAVLVASYAVFHKNQGNVFYSCVHYCSSFFFCGGRGGNEVGKEECSNLTKMRNS